MIIFLQFILILVIFLPIRYVAYWITEVKGLPEWLNYKPFNCKLCLTFWSLMAAYTAIWLSFSCLYTGIGGIIFTILNAIAMWIDQKNKTVKFDIEKDGNIISLIPRK